jgi:two-component system, cell cycle sensor histidine kinase and response regulator CckA
MTVGLFLGLLFCVSLVLWLFLRQRQENLLRSRVIDATNCSVLVTDATAPHHPVMYVNPAFLSLTGYAEREVLGLSTEILAGPETERMSTEKLALALQDGQPCQVGLRHYRKDGTPFWNEVTLSPVKDRAGRVISVIWIMNDVSHVRQLEMDLHRMLPVTFRSDRTLEGMAVATDTVVGGIAHELNNSLTAVLGFSELALPLVSTESKAHRHINQVIVAGRKARELVHKLHRPLNHASCYHEPTATTSHHGPEPATLQIEVSNAVGPRR